ncbi:MAG: SulP family inorganic anion transporter [Desulfotalea sp.]
MSTIKQISLLHKFLPGLAVFLNYKPEWLKNDIVAGLSVAAIALPVGIAYADLAGVPAVFGIYSATFPLFVYALFGTSKQLMIGPDAATCLMLATSIAPLAAGDPDRYISLVMLMTLLTGVIYLLAGSLKLGFIANFFSMPILAGYLNAIALIIIVGQIQKLLGFSVESDNFFIQVYQVISNLSQTNVFSLCLGGGLLVFLLIMKKIFPIMPSPLVTVILGAIFVWAFSLDAKGVKVLGHVPGGLPELVKFPTLNFDEFKEILRDAIALMLVSFTSGILTAKSFAQRNHYRVDANRELISFGLGNIVSGMLSGYPVTGADSRTAVNDNMGGKTQLVGIVAGCIMVGALFWLTAPMGYIPIPVLAAVIIVSAYGLFDVSTLKFLKHSTRTEYILSLGTTLGALILGILPGVLLAVSFAIIHLIATISKPKTSALGMVGELDNSYHSLLDYPHAKTHSNILIYRFEADLLFFNADFFIERLWEIVEGNDGPLSYIIIDASPISLIDITAIDKIRHLNKALSKQGISLLITHERQSNKRFLYKAWLEGIKETAEFKDFPTMEAAISYCKKS